jgi:hypothetical protein
MKTFGKMFEAGVRQALKLLKDPHLFEGLRENLAKSADVVLKVGKEILKQTAKGGRI